MIEVAETPRQWPLALGQKATYDVLVDGQSVARYPSREDAEADMRARRKGCVSIGRNPDLACPPEAPSQYCVFVDGYMVAGYPTLEQAEAGARQTEVKLRENVIKVAKVEAKPYPYYEVRQHGEWVYQTTTLEDAEAHAEQLRKEQQR